MDSNFFEYLQKIELLAFFSGYPLIYTIVFFIAGNKRLGNDFKNRVVSILPFGYALMGTLYLGFLLRNLYPDYSLQNIRLSMQQPWLMSWGLLSILFWIPALSRKKILSLIHSIVFFFILIKDIFLQLSASHDRSFVKNDMNVYTVSLLLNLGALLLVLLLSLVYSRKNIRF